MLVCTQELFLWYDITSVYIYIYTYTQFVCELLKKNAYFLYRQKRWGKFRTH